MRRTPLVTSNSGARSRARVRHVPSFARTASSWTKGRPFWITKLARAVAPGWPQVTVTDSPSMVAVGPIPALYSFTSQTSGSAWRTRVEHIRKQTMLQASHASDHVGREAHARFERIIIAYSE